MKSITRTVQHPTTTSSNFVIVRDKDLGYILFGCPPELIKYFNLKKISIPPDIVIPHRTFRKGKNFIDLEFVVYAILFFQRSKKSITIACTETQEKNIRIVLEEALFGPCLKNIFRVFLFESFDKRLFNKSQLNSLGKAAEQIGSKREIFSRFKEIMSLKCEEAKVISEVRPVIVLLLKKIFRVDKELHNRIYRMFTKAYVKASMLKLEMDTFSVCEE